MTDRLPDGYFDDLYSTSGDPWGFRDRWYEQRKRALTLALLPRARYHHGFEPGCSLGVLTAALAPRCDRLVATDVSDAALAAARTRLAGHENVELRRWALGDEWPTDPVDLVVLSEVLYYLEAPLLRRVLDQGAESLEPGGTMLAVHWRHPVADYPLGGDEVHEQIAGTAGLVRIGRYLDDDLVAECYQRTPPPATSVAAAEQLV